MVVDVINSDAGSFVDETGTTINFTYTGDSSHAPDDRGIAFGAECVEYCSCR